MSGFDFNGHEKFRQLDAENKRKLLLRCKMLKRELEGEWMTDYGRFEEWQSRIFRETGIMFDRARYNAL